eukprot:TRINITY_DN9395_c0_g1_i2.p1 TRINITY_DN9395_c0_g1~~TRINITY_DN9395_c0_g1_i2.p1  ORF type:complete len:154 (-),score=34.89 TRINITY_DN9395_c0_g1_i2:23-484(-)
MEMREKFYQKVFMELFPSSESKSSGMRNYLKKLFSSKDRSLINKSCSELPGERVKLESRKGLKKINMIKPKSVCNLKQVIQLNDKAPFHKRVLRERDNPSLDALIKSKKQLLNRNYSSSISRNYHIPLFQIRFKPDQAKLLSLIHISEPTRPY